MKYSFFRKIMLVIMFIVIMPLLALASIKVKDEPFYRENPKYLLDGTLEGNDGTYEYYLLTDNTYAISLLETKKTTTGTLTIPYTHNSANVTGIWRSGFAGSHASTIILNTNIKTIDYEAFMASSITTMTLPYSINSIGDGAFYACSSLNTVKFNNSSKATGSTCEVDDGIEEYTYSTLREIPSFCFFKCNALTTLLLPSKIEVIGYEAFNGCISLASTLCLSNIKTIHSRAFQSCVSLSEIYFPTDFFTASDTDIEAHAFNYCNSNLTFYFSGTKSDVSTWVSNHPNWGLYSDTSSSSYEYTLNSGDTGMDSDWLYNTVDGKTTILSYIGSTSNVKYLSVPTYLPTGSTSIVTHIQAGALDTVKSNLTFLFLPKYLERVENSFFSGFNNLQLIDINTNCSSYSISSFTPLIDLSQLTNLKYIGTYAFSKLNKLQTFTELHLPYSLIAIGDSAFGQSSQSYNMYGVNEFTWDYKDGVSALEVIGHDAFYKIGAGRNNPGNSNNNLNNNLYRHYINSSGTTNYSLTTLVFPKTFRSFGYTSADMRKYGFASQSNTPAHAFAGSPLLSKVIFKGGDDSSDLYLGIQTFAFNESLRTIIFEERPEKTITFHNEGGRWTEPCIGSNAGRTGNDFYGDPFLQTLILPNVDTKLRFQDCSLQGNSRCAMYLTGTYLSNMVYSKEQNLPYLIDHNTESKNNQDISGCKLWNSIGDESFYQGSSNKGYIGYCFSSSATSNGTYNGASGFGLDQIIPYHENVHYKETLSVDGILNSNGTKGLEIEVGEDTYTNDLVISNKCAFVCNNTTRKATLSKYLYDCYDQDFSGTAVIPPSVDHDGNTYTVNAIGDSAFSAAFCDMSTPHGQAYPDNKFKDLSKVYVPDTITSIGDYAFMRAYGVRELSTYTTYHGDSTTLAEGNQYVMPSSLTYIGKHAFAFCNIAQFRKIPYNCQFYENQNATTYETSVFSNNLSLRKITFLNDFTESTSSAYYTTTTYASETGDTYTSAIYSNDSETNTYNPNCLLMILNRDKADYAKASLDYTTDKTFKGGYKSNPALYGAYKMGFFINTLAMGSYKADGSGKLLPQALFSAVCKRSGNGTSSTLTDYYMYLYNPIQNYYNNSVDLTAMSFSSGASINLPNYTFDGCENLSKISFPKVDESDNISIPTGLFANIDITGLTFVTPDKDGNMVSRSDGVLDLTYTGYTGIGEEAFKNFKGITKLIAPKLTKKTFTISKSAFEGCTNLTELDFSQVGKRTQFKDSAFKDSGVTTITWPADDVEVRLGQNNFYNCDSLTSITLPAGIDETIGHDCFSECSNLTTVSASSNLTNLKTINANCFYNCTKLTNFDFSKFKSLVTIGDNAFSTDNYNSGMTICTSGAVSLPSSLVNIGIKAFNNTGIINLTINSSSIAMNTECFARCSNLASVVFTQPNCSWTYNNHDYFSYDTALTTVILPTGFNVNIPETTLAHSYFWCSTSAKIYTYSTHFDNQSIDNKKWREHTTGQFCDLYYYAATSKDLLNASGEFLDNTNGLYWTNIGGFFVELGSATSVTFKVVTFSSGYKLDSYGNLTAPS